MRFVCPHSVIRARYYHEDRLDKAPATFKSAAINVRGFPEVRFSLQFYVEDCTGCGLCIEACPAVDPRDSPRRAINLANKAALIETERTNIRFFESLPVNDRARVDFANVRGVQFLQPLFEFSGRARDAVKHHTSSCSRNSSATGCKSPTPPVARPSTARICR